MELQGLYKSSHFSPLGGEKAQMLNLNQRLETYLNRVKLLDEENAKLAKEIQALRKNHHGNLERRKCLDEELRYARQQVDMVWKERVYAEVDVARLSEEFETLDLQLQRETQAQLEAKARAEQSRRELEEERRAQIWLREKVSQLEHEMKSLIQTHQEEVANMEAMLTQSKAIPAMRPAQQIPNFLELGQEYNQKASRAWQEAAEAYQGQLTRLEESLNETRQRLTQVNKEKSESVLKLQNLDKELLGLEDLRVHLEKTVDQQRESHCQDVQMLQEHLEALEREKHALAQQMDQLLLENRGLMQMKMSLNMEVATYRALLDSENLRGDISLQKQPRNIYIKDAVFSPRGVKENYQLSPSPKTTSLSLVRSMSGKSKPLAVTATPILYQKLVPRKEKLEISKEKVEDNTVHQQPTESTPYPNVLKDGAVENFRPQEVHEKVTYAEPLSPPNEQEVLETLELEKTEDYWNATVDQTHEEKPCAESDISYQVGSSLNSETPFTEACAPLVEPTLIEEPCSFFVKSEKLEMPFEKEEMEKPQAPIDAWVEEEYVDNTKAVHVSDHFETVFNIEKPFNEASPQLVKEVFTEELCSFSVKSEPSEMPFEKEEMEKQQAPIDAWVEKESIQDTETVHEEEESSDSETEAFLEPNFDTKSSTPASECEPEESLTNQLVDVVKEDFAYDRVAAASDDISPPKDNLYPDGEEMDTWDSVIERNPGLRTEDVIETEEAIKQHAEPEEDISAKEAQQQKQEMLQDQEPEAKIASSTVEPQIDEEEQNASMKDDDEQEDSQNVSVSWRTELEGDSYAQENTLADTRPLIRYKSDETDANTQASHVDDADSSDSEQDKKVGETGSGTWTEDKTRRFGTMEDLCEEAEGEVMDEEYDLEYLQEREDKLENDRQGNDEETQEEVNKSVVEGLDQELDTDKLVEMELENLSTDCYSAHFAQQQGSAKDNMLPETLAVQQMAWDEEKLEDMPLFPESEAQADEKGDEHFEISQPDEDAEVQEDQEMVKDVEEEDKHDISMVTHCDTTEDISEVRKGLVWSSASQELEGQSFENLSFEQQEHENVEESEEKESIVQDLLTVYESHPNGGYSNDDVNQSDKLTSTPLEADQEVLPDNGVQLRDTTPEEIFVPEEVDTEFPEVPVTAEWEVLGNPNENVGNTDDTFDELAQKCLSSDDKVHDHDSLSPTDEPINISPESVHDEGDLFIVKDSTELMKTNGKANLDDLYSISANDDFWVSPLETGATYQPDEADTKHTEWNLGFGDVGSREPEDLAEKSTMAFEQKEVTQILARSAVKGEIVHSEESEDDSEGLSSGEE